MSWLEDFVPGPVVQRSSSYAVPACSGQVIVVTALSAACTITLPASPVLGQLVIVKRAGAYDRAITIAGNGKTIDGAATFAALPSFACVSICYGGSNWHVIDASVATPSAPAVAGVVYVSKAGNDATGVRGDISRPFLTITAALSVAQSGDAVRVGPGTFDDADQDAGWTWPDVVEMSLIGSGRDVTILAAAVSAGGAVLNISPQTATDSSAVIADLTLYETGRGSATLEVDGSTKSVKSLELRGVRSRTDVDFGVLLDKIESLYISDCRFDNFTARGIVSAKVLSSPNNAAFLFDWDAGDATFWAGLGAAVSTVDIVGSPAGLTITGRVVLSVTGAKMGNLGAALTSSGADAGYITAACPFDSVSISGDSVNTGANLDGSTMSSLTVARSAGADRIAVSARGGAIAGVVSAGDKCDIDIRGSSFVQASLAVVGDGTIERSAHRQAIELANGDVDVALAVPFKTANYSVGYELTVAAIPVTPRANKAATGFRATSTAADAFASFTITHD